MWFYGPKDIKMVFKFHFLKKKKKKFKINSPTLWCSIKGIHSKARVFDIKY